MNTYHITPSPAKRIGLRLRDSAMIFKLDEKDMEHVSQDTMIMYGSDEVYRVDNIEHKEDGTAIIYAKGVRG